MGASKNDAQSSMGKGREMGRSFPGEWEARVLAPEVKLWSQKKSVAERVGDRAAEGRGNPSKDSGTESGQRDVF